jgi:cob(I)alamin adenosyltransferase
MKGLVHIYTGDGKGKTTAAVGLGIRACGRGLRVLMVQFLKGADTGEIHTLKRLEPGFTLYRSTETKKFTWNMNAEELRQTAESQKSIFDYAVEAAKSGNWDMVILDEVMGALGTGMLRLKDIAEFIGAKPEGLELVLTGRNAPAELIGLADYVSEIKAVRHPMEKGIPARIGIEC